MQERNTIQEYLDSVTAQIRWKRARPLVRQELAHHLEDQRAAFAAEGCENAEELAVKEMGDPVSVGAELDRIHRPKSQRGILAITSLLALAGAVLRVMLTADWARYDMSVDPLRTALAFVLGCGTLLTGYFLDVSRLSRWGRVIYAGALAAGVLALLFFPKVNGIPYYTKYVILCCPVVYAFWLYTCRGKGWSGLILALSGGIPLVLICLLTPYAFGLVVLLLTGFALTVAAAWGDWFGLGRRKSLCFTALCTAALSLSALFLVMSSESSLQRLKIIFRPDLSPRGAGYLAVTIREALGASRWLGTGTEFSPLPFELTVPGWEGDSFLSTIIYDLGWLPFLALILTFAALIAWMLRRCLRQKNQLGKSVTLAAAMTLLLQALFSAAWNLGFTLFCPPFPLMVGNVNTVLNMGLIGLALSMFRNEQIFRDPAWNRPLPLPRYRIRIVVQKC